MLLSRVGTLLIWVKASSHMSAIVGDKRLATSATNENISPTSGEHQRRRREKQKSFFSRQSPTRNSRWRIKMSETLGLLLLQNRR